MKHILDTIGQVYLILKPYRKILCCLKYLPYFHILVIAAPSFSLQEQLHRALGADPASLQGQKEQMTPKAGQMLQRALPDQYFSQLKYLSPPSGIHINVVKFY